MGGGETEKKRSGEEKEKETSTNKSAHTKI